MHRYTRTAQCVSRPLKPAAAMAAPSSVHGSLALEAHLRAAYTDAQFCDCVVVVTQVRGRV